MDLAPWIKSVTGKYEMKEYMKMAVFLKHK